MATNLSDGVAALARQIAIDQIAQDIEVNGKLAQKADATSLSNLQTQVSNQAGQIAANTEAASEAATAAQAAQTSVETLETQIITICNEVSGA